MALYLVKNIWKTWRPVSVSPGEISFCDLDFNVTLSCNFVLPPDNAVLAMTSVVK